MEQVTKGERRVANVTFDRGFTRIAYTVGMIEAPPELHVAAAPAPLHQPQTENMYENGHLCPRVDRAADAGTND